MTTTAGVTYTCEGDGKRVQRSTGKLYWYGAGSDPLAESDAAGAITDEYVFFAGKRVARRGSAGSVFYYFADHLDTARIVTNAAGAILDDSDFDPFGGERPVLSTSGNAYKFTGKERDAESGLDHFQFRKFSSAMGRFTSPDPAGMMAVDIGNPQTLNRYAYVLNNPLSFIDPFGLDCVFLNDAGTGVDQNGIDQNSSPEECGKTGCYWVDGTVTQVKTDAEATTISLTGTTNGTDQTTASYQQDAVVTVGEYNNTSNNPYNHIALGLLGQPQLGQNPRSDAHFL